MALTRIDCLVHRGAKNSVENSLYAVLNPTREPGSLVAAGAVAARDNLGGHVACKISLERFVEAMLDGAADFSRNVPESASMTVIEDRCVAIIEDAFRRANNSVYEFGHKLAAGGRMAASLIGFYLKDRAVAVGRAGNASAYLLRGAEVCPFFTDSAATERSTGFVGENSVVTVELSSIAARAHDIIVVFPSLLSEVQKKTLANHAFRAEVARAVDVAAMVKDMYPDQQTVPFVLQAQIGPEVIYLNKAMGLGVIGNASGSPDKSPPKVKVSDV